VKPAGSEVATLVVENIGELVTGDPTRMPSPGVLGDAALAAVGDRIVYAGPMSDLDVATDSTTEGIDAGGAAVIPGFIDCHTHICWLGDRADEYALRAQGVSYEEIARGGGGIRSTVASTAAGSLEALTQATRDRAARMLRAGTTTVEIKSGYGMSNDAEMRQLAAITSLRDDKTLPSIVATWLPLHGIPEGNRGQYLDEVIRGGLPHAARMVDFVDCFCDEGAWSVAECEQLLQRAKEHDMTPRLHAEQRSHSGGARLAARLRAASVDHLEHATDGDFRDLAGHQVSGVLLPGAALVLGGPPPPGRRMLDAGMPVALATDCNPGTCYSESMPLMISLAVATAGLTPSEALTAATAGGARALRLDAADLPSGRLLPGHRADAVILDSPHWLDVAYHLGATVVDRVILAGRLVP